jgi:amino acid adenylation domain-containing protein
MYFLHELDPTAYTISLVHRFPGAVDVSVLREAVADLVDRHDALRTRFELRDGELCQLVESEPDLAWYESSAAEISDVDSWTAEQSARPFDLLRGPLLRASVLRLADGATVFVLVVHHIVVDGWSVEILQRELLVDYLGRLGLPGGASVPAPRRQYAEYTRWQVEWLRGEEADRQRRYWTRRLAGELPDTGLLPDRVVARRGSGSYEFEIPSATVRGLRAICRRTGNTFYAGLLTTLQVLLGRYTDSDDVLLGSPVANRRRREFEGTVGLFTNTVVVRSDLSGDPAFVDLLDRTRNVVFDAQDHQELPFEQIVAAGGPRRGADDAPLFRVMFVLREDEGTVPDWPDVPAEGTKCELLCTVRRSGDRAACRVEYRPDLFAESTVRRLARHWLHLMAGAVADPTARLSALPALPHDEASPVGTAPADSPAGPEADPGCCHDVFAAGLADHGDAVAVTDDGVAVTYSELDRRANRLAHRLRRLGVGPDVLVGLCLPRSVGLIVGVLGIMKAGGAYLPLDPVHPAGRLRTIVRDAGVTLVVASAATGELVRELEVSAVDIDDLVGEPVTAPAVTVLPDHLAYAVYTSGSTGTPKGVLVSHRNVTRLLSTARHWLGFRADDVWTMFHSIAFDVSVWEMWGALLHGGRLVIVPFDVSRSPYGFVELLRRDQVTMLSQTPSAFHLLARAVAATGLAVRTVMFAGESLDDAGFAGWSDVPGLTMVNMYGITETTVHATYHVVSAASPPTGGRTVIGRPLPDLSIHLLDRRGRSVPIGAAGEIHVGGAGLARGYLRRPGLTAARFVPDAFGPRPGGRLYRSGDRGRDIGDALEYLGRTDDQVKIRGFRVELGEVASALGTHPLVRRAVASVRPDAAGRNVLVAHVVADDEATVAALRDHLAPVLPDYLIPSVFARVQEIPLTVNGKVDRGRLPDPATAPLAIGVDRVVPRGRLQTALAAVFRDVLGVPDVGIDDNYFALGGDSIRSLQVVSRAADRGVGFSVADLVRHPTIRRLTNAVAAGDVTAAPGVGQRPFGLVTDETRALLPADAVDAYPLTRIQGGVLYEMLSDPERAAAYHLVVSARVTAELDLPRLSARLRRLVDDQDVLRTSIHLADYPEPVQIVHRDAALPVGHADLRGQQVTTRDAAISEYVSDQTVLPFDLESAPLLRVFVHHLSDAEYQLTLTACHALFDGWSLAWLTARLVDAVPNTDPPGVRFADHVALEQEVLCSRAAQRYWAERLDDIRPLRVGAAEGAPQRRVSAAFDDLTEDLRSLAAGLGTPLKSVLVAAFYHAVSQWTGTRGHAIGLVTDCRPETGGADRLLGLFLNIVPFGLAGAAVSWADLVRQAFRAEAEPGWYRRFPYAELQRRHTDHGPLVDVSFNFVDFHAVGSGVAAQDNVNRQSFPLTVITGPGWIAVETRPDVAAPSAVADLVSVFEATLRAMVRAPDSPVVRLPLSVGTLVELLDRQSARTPDSVALVFPSATITYGALRDRAARFAGSLIRRGVRRGDVVALAMDRCVEMAIGMVGVLWAGAAYLALDSVLPPERAEWMREDSGAVCLVREADVRAAFAEPPAGPADLSPASAAYLMYTSGSTGRPKGVVVAHGAVVNYLLWSQAELPVRPADRVLQKTPYSFDVSVAEFFGALIAGATLVVARPGGQRDPGYLHDMVTGQDVTVAYFVPTMLDAFLDVPADRETALRRVVCIGETLRPTLRDAFLAGYNASLYNLYGPTETTIAVTCWRCEPGGGDVPIGRAIRHTTVQALDDLAVPVAPGVVGELYVGGAALALGYHERPGLTADRFLPDPLGLAGARRYRTGDLGSRSTDDVVSYSRRGDDQVKIRGVRIEPGEIEKTLLAHSEVARAVVVAHEFEPGDTRLVAYVVPAGGTLTPHTLRGWLRTRLPEEMVPSRVILLAELPSTPNGKVDRKALPVPAERPDVGTSPRTPAEELLVMLFAETLGVPRVGVEDDFFDLGGHSLSATRLVSRVEQTLGTRVPPAAVFEHRTVTALAAHLRSGQQTDALGPLLTLRRTGTGPAVFCLPPVTGLSWCYAALTRSLHRRFPLYGLQAPGLRDGPVPPSFGDLVDRHVAEIRAVAPRGPYFLLGWSMGGDLAHAVAAALRRHGEHIGLCALVDASPNPRMERAPDMLAALLHGLGHPSETSGTRPLDRDGFRERLRSAGSAVSTLDDESLDRLIAVFDNNIRLLDDYVTPVLDADITFFTATGGSSRLDHGDWRRFVSGTIDNRDLPFAHHRLADPAALDMIGAVLNEKLP